eukprot:GHVT01031363.1.p1 GENE.GHVT01031363.1~~GHVT01031363.1.p1  ORF type:complete len:128 (+),score=2.71 GHVT01031363.1:1407-1790(+)
MKLINLCRNPNPYVSSKTLLYFFRKLSKYVHSSRPSSLKTSWISSFSWLSELFHSTDSTSMLLEAGKGCTCSRSVSYLLHSWAMRNILSATFSCSCSRFVLSRAFTARSLNLLVSSLLQGGKHKAVS